MTTARGTTHQSQDRRIGAESNVLIPPTATSRCCGLQPLSAAATSGDRLVVARTSAGRSSPGAPVSYSREVLSLLGELGIASVTIVGNSFGGRVALDVARVAPERVRSLVLVAPGRREWDWSDAVRRYAEAEDAAVAAGDVERVVELNVRFWLDGPHRTPDQVEPDVRAAVATMQREGVGRLLAASEAGGGGEELPDPAPSVSAADVRAPTLILVGDLDVSDMLAISNWYEQELPNARRVVMRGVAHMPSLEQRYWKASEASTRVDLRGHRGGPCWSAAAQQLLTSRRTLLAAVDQTRCRRLCRGKLGSAEDDPSGISLGVRDTPRRRFTNGFTLPSPCCSASLFDPQVPPEDRPSAWPRPRPW
jgi:pimeloyl-ACP methyl ester carboxylesterase